MNSSVSLWDVIACNATDAGRLLSTVARDVAGGTPTTVSQLARSVGFSQAKTHRLVGRLEQAGLLRTETELAERRDRRWVYLNEHSPNYDLLVQALYRNHGVDAVPSMNPVERMIYRRFMRDIPYEIRTVIPSELHPADRRSARLFAEDTDDGPPLVLARMWEHRLRQLRNDVGTLERDLQDAYSEFRSERDRDMIHAVLHVGVGLSYAVDVVAHVSDDMDPRLSARMGGREWQLVCAATRATVPLCERVIERLTRGVQLAQQRRQELRLISDLESEIERFCLDERSESTANAVRHRHEEQKEELESRRAELARIESAMDSTYRIGGITDIDDVDTGGERMIVARLRRIAEIASSYAEDMEGLTDAAAS